MWWFVKRLYQFLLPLRFSFLALLVVAFALPTRLTTGRALAVAGWVAAGVVLLTALAMAGAVVVDAGNVRPPG